MRKSIVHYAPAIVLAIAATLCANPLVPRQASARDHGQYADAPLKAWFDALASGKGLCCSFADGVRVEDVDWDANGPDGRYRVRLDGQWIVVPADAVVRAPNKFGAAVVWPYQDGSNTIQIRCFLPEAGA